MGRVIAAFFLGLVIGAGGLYLACRALLMIAEGPDMAAARERDMSLAQYREYVDLRYERPFLLVSAAGGLICAWWCAYAAGTGESATAGRPGRRRRRRRSGDDPLTREEFRQVLQACLLVPLDERSPEYVRGLVVGRLAESAPAVAHKVDGFSDRHMAALYGDLLHRQAGLSRS